MLKNNNQNQFDFLENNIRNGKHVNCPKILYDYLYLGDQYACTRPPVIKHKTYERMYHILLETICDPLIEKHWRYTCLDNINRPLVKLQRCVRNKREEQKVISFYKELAIVSQYFL